MTLKELAAKIDYTFLNPYASLKEYEVFLKRAKEFPFRGICLPPALLSFAKSVEPNLRYITVIAFPFGYQELSIKLKEIERALSSGAEELDYVPNIIHIKSGQFKALEEELKQLRDLTSGTIIKVILETPKLSKEEIKKVLPILIDTGIDFVKTSTGFSGKATSLEEVELLKKLSQGKIKIKASGGIKTLKEALSFFSKGADVIGTSSGYEILKEFEESLKEANTTLIVYVDGCSLGNPGPGGYAAIIKRGEDEIILSGGEAYTTNNRMELTAVLKALSSFKEPQRFIIYCDSEYVIKGATEWLFCWKLKGFKTSEGKPVKNQDLWMELERWLSFHRVKFEKVPAHSGHPENERADKIAKKEAEKWKRSIS
ncbi:MAG: ribonuclease HI [Caldimicrobium sp.]